MKTSKLVDEVLKIKKLEIFFVNRTYFALLSEIPTINEDDQEDEVIEDQRTETGLRIKVVSRSVWKEL